MVVIAGPTASGKSDLAIEVALRLGAEIISADSQAVYRAFDIGTAKPSAAQLARVPHHFISEVEPGTLFSAAEFARQADERIRDLESRGRRVVVAGGTGLYIRTLLHGVVKAPPRNEALRAELEALAGSEGNEALWARLNAVDPATAARLPPSDQVRLIRALEIHAGTGETASALRARHQFGEARHPFALFVLSPPREALYETINRRTRLMFEQGLVEETRRLVAEGFRSAAPMKSVGYAEALEVVEGRMELTAAMNLVAQRTRHYAKRQGTWFRKEQGAVFLTPPYPIDTIVAASA